MKARKILFPLICVLLAAALIFCAACGKDGGKTADGGEATVLGEGSSVFDFSVTDEEGTVTNFEIHTDKTTVGDALLELELIAGDEGPYGLYVKTVNGITLDADKDGAYWAFYVNGEYATHGVDTTDIFDGDSYAFVCEKI